MKFLEELAKHYGLPPKHENETEKDFEKRVNDSLKEAGVPLSAPSDGLGKLALMAIFL